MDDVYTAVGTIINTHGVRGGVKVFPQTDDPKRFESLEMVYLGKEKTPVHIAKVQYMKQMVLLTFREFNDMNDVLPYKGEDVFIYTKDRLPLPQDRYYISDLIGLTVYDEAGNRLGVLIDVYEGLANDVYIISNERGQGMIPAVKEHIKSVDVAKQKMIVCPSEGMIP